MFIVSPVALRSSDGGLDSIITNMPQKVGIPLLGQQDMWIESMSLTLLGKPPGGAATPFMTLPTSCGPATASIAARVGERHAGDARGGPVHADRLRRSWRSSRRSRRRSPPAGRRRCAR